MPEAQQSHACGRRRASTAADQVQEALLSSSPTCRANAHLVRAAATLREGALWILGHFILSDRSPSVFPEH